MAIFGRKKKEEKEEKKVSKKPSISSDKKKKEKKDELSLKGDIKDIDKISRILIRPLVSEKITNLQKENKYVFEVHPKANKIEIKKAIKKLYGVTPLKVNIVKIKGKPVRFRLTRGYTSPIKKAIITLKEGESINLEK